MRRPPAFVCQTGVSPQIATTMPNQDDIQYALEVTRVLQEPDRRIDTFGETRFEFQLLSEPMDRIGQVRIRSGEMQAQRPMLLKPDGYRDYEFQGFEDEAREKFDELLDRMRSQGRDLAILQYGFQFRRSDIKEELVNAPMEAVREQVLEAARMLGNPAQAIIEGVDDTWEISLLKFSLEMILQSQSINAFDLKRRGLI